MKTTLKLPGVSPAVSQILVHFGAVFLLAFGTQLVAGASGAVSVSTLLALLTSAAAAGVISVAHTVLGLVPLPVGTLVAADIEIPYNALGISPKIKNRAYQVLASVVSSFLVLFGAQLIGGAAGLTSLPSVVALFLAAIAAGVTGVVTFLLGLIPAPKVT